MSLRMIAIVLTICGALAGLLVMSDPMYAFADWLRFTLVGFAVVFLVIYFKKRKQSNG